MIRSALQMECDMREQHRPVSTVAYATGWVLFIQLQTGTSANLFYGRISPLLMANIYLLFFQNKFYRPIFRQLVMSNKIAIKFFTVLIDTIYKNSI